jgi:hypothetical protein
MLSKHAIVDQSTVPDGSLLSLRDTRLNDEKAAEQEPVDVSFKTRAAPPNAL